MKKDKLNIRTYDKARYQLVAFVYPRLGAAPISKIFAQELLAALRKIEVSGRQEAAHRTRQRCGQIFRFAIATGRAEQDPSVYLRGALAPVFQ